METNTAAKQTNAELLAAPLLLASAVTRAEQTLQRAHPDYKTEPQAELAALRARYEAEAPARALRTRLERAGFKQSSYNHAGTPAYQIWVRKNKVTGRWDRFSIAQ